MSLVQKTAKREEIKPRWNASTLIARKLQLRQGCVQNVIKFLDDGATIPFIARYRKDDTDNMSPDALREVASEIEELRTVESKIRNVHNSISKLGKMSNELETSLVMSTTLVEVESLYAPYKPGHKGSYAERARALGLDELTKALLDGKSIRLEDAVIPNKKGLESVGEVEKGVKHIIADIVSKDKDVMDAARELCQTSNVNIESTKAKAKAKKDPSTNEQKFELYFDFRCLVKNARPHQILALNRGEDLNVLTVKIVIPEHVKQRIKSICLNKVYKKVEKPVFRSLIGLAINDSYDRLIEPMLMRTTRSDLTKMAEKASISVFTENLKGLLMMPPVKQKTILGLDPGFKNGCKYAVISHTGDIINTGVVYLHDHKANKFEEKMKLKDIIKTFRCETVAIGNGVACRETEQIISDMIKANGFKHVVYCIVDECGASIYSVSDEAQKELPNFDPTLRGAVSIGRRLQDPLAELVKIDPKNLGVGMYQHDLNKTSLNTALTSVVEECVSFVGVDLNTCSECLLRRVAGLNAAKAKKIIEWRAQNGSFTNRQQLLSIKGLGKKGFEQCAGFVRITKNLEGHGHSYQSIKSEIKEELYKVKEEIKEEVQQIKEEIKDAVSTSSVSVGKKRKADKDSNQTSGKKVKKGEKLEWNPLDSTAVHPESYEIAEKLAKYLRVDLQDIGTPRFIAQVMTAATNTNLEQFSSSNDAGVSTVKLIADALQQPLSYDIREGFQKPIFKQEVMSVSDLKTGSAVTGRVTNVTHFGAFVDIGVGINGLIHSSKMGRFGKVSVGDNVEVKVDTKDLNRQRIGLSLTHVKGR